jgi:hypothetical protein
MNLVYTSCFANVKRLPTASLFEQGIQPVAISRGVPRGWRGKRELRLAPARAMLWAPEAEFDRYYSDLLAALDPRELWQQLTADGPVALLCWEKPGEPCHRRDVAAWLQKHLGFEVPEFGRG